MVMKNTIIYMVFFLLGAIIQQIISPINFFEKEVKVPHFINVPYTPKLFFSPYEKKIREPNCTVTKRIEGDSVLFKAWSVTGIPKSVTVRYTKTNKTFTVFSPLSNSSNGYYPISNTKSSVVYRSYVVEKGLIIKKLKHSDAGVMLISIVDSTNTVITLCTKLVVEPTIDEPTLKITRLETDGTKCLATIRCDAEQHNTLLSFMGNGFLDTQRNITWFNTKTLIGKFIVNKKLTVSCVSINKFSVSESFTVSIDYQCYVNQKKVSDNNACSTVRFVLDTRPCTVILISAFLILTVIACVLSYKAILQYNYYKRRKTYVNLIDVYNPNNI
ncbi:hypothetical protein [Pteropox virus]|uniref:Ig-like domain-containing protein n=1 Tax=Pteropox virus TaxID=1873698 RepID=A0A1B1MRD4_9POXV|nr:hypothetical protein [Pteropox virus]ANS71095.1 hypothetical protein [Pteropox virus]